MQVCPSALLLTKAQMKKFDFVLVHTYYTQYGPIKNGRIKNQGSDFEKK